MKPVYRSRLILVPIPTGTTTGAIIAFPDQPDLKKGARVTGYETFTFDDLNTTPLGTGISNADAANTLVTLSEGSDERVRQIPYLAARTPANSGQVRELMDFEVEWTQCALQFTFSVAASVAPILVHFYYPSDLARK
jgi:hypothetical protein